ncbi:hypothetical protein RND81_09G075700 [Saponaria officinalis]|uniref:Uncharacterized protein n=1 Tax=Saponaria officinalis TaxID=3572 RepID=A0AAW1IIU8_SAPOF
MNSINRVHSFISREGEIRNSERNKGERNSQQILSGNQPTSSQQAQQIRAACSRNSKSNSTFEGDSSHHDPPKNTNTNYARSASTHRTCTTHHRNTLITWSTHTLDTR